jgi:hypothetical protein
MMMMMMMMACRGNLGPYTIVGSKPWMESLIPYMRIYVGLCVNTLNYKTKETRELKHGVST